MDVLCRQTRPGWCDVHEAPWQLDEAACDRAELDEDEDTPEERAIRRALSTAPPLSVQVRARLARLLTPSP